MKFGSDSIEAVRGRRSFGINWQRILYVCVGEINRCREVGRYRKVAIPMTALARRFFYRGGLTNMLKHSGRQIVDMCRHLVVGIH